VGCGASRKVPRAPPGCKRGAVAGEALVRGAERRAESSDPEVRRSAAVDRCR